MKVASMILLVIISGIIGSYVGEYLKNRFIYKQLKFINRYQKILGMEDILIKHKGKTFYLLVDYLIDDPIYKYKLYINEELVLTDIELNHGKTNSRQLEYNYKRSEQEINKLMRLAYKKAKRMYHEKYLKIDYSFTSFWED